MLNICLGPRGPEPNQTEQSHLSLAEPSPEPNKDESSPEIIRAEPRDKLSQAQSLEPAPSPLTQAPSQAVESITKLSQSSNKKLRADLRDGAADQESSRAEPRIEHRVDPRAKCRHYRSGSRFLEQRRA